MLLLGLLFSLLLFAGATMFAGKRPHKSEKLSTGLVTGLILGTFIGGSCTVGTAQLAFRLGLSAWWFSLGGAVGCLFLALTMAGPLRRDGSQTIVGLLRNRYGQSAGLSATLLNSLGTYINILVQIISATSVLAVIVPGTSRTAETLFAMLMMIGYVFFGGSRGAGLVGLLKLVLIFSAMMICGFIVLGQCGGPMNIIDMVHGIDSSDTIPFLNLFGRGIGTDLGACFSLVAGLASTQIYAQAVIQAESDAAAKKGLVISSLLLPLLGTGGILVGLWMRAHYPQIVDKTALTQFIQMQFPDVFAGTILGTLFICVVGTGAGLTLGVATVIRQDIITGVLKKKLRGPQVTTVTRILIAGILLSAASLCLAMENETILIYAFLSMALRGGGVIAPLCLALWLKRDVRPSFATASVLVGSLAVIVFNFVKVLPFDPLFAGIALSALLLMLGLQPQQSVER